MIISRTPLRISFAGGGSDCPWFYRQKTGMVVSTTINKYITIAVYPSFSGKYILHYNKIEIADTIDKIKNELIREILKLRPDLPPVEVVSMGDVPGGTGLGSSGAFAVGLLKCLFPQAEPEELARIASHIELEVLNRPIGKQDHYSAAFGGFNEIIFHNNDMVKVHGLSYPEELNDTLLIFYTGLTHDANVIHEDILQKMTPEKQQLQLEMTFLAGKMRLLSGKLTGQPFLLKGFGPILAEGWRLKKLMSPGISTPQIDNWYERGIQAGATGGKLLGAGGGGFLLFYAPPETHETIKQALSELQYMPFQFTYEGSEIIHND